MSTHFSIGIDLGTSNSAIALEDFAGGQQPNRRDYPNSRRQSNRRKSQPFHRPFYIPHPDEFPQNGMRLPWSKGDGEPIVGHFAREHGALISDRLITSAKSWLSNFHIDPEKAGPAVEVRHQRAKTFSAFECSRRYLEHMREGFLYTRTAAGPPVESR